MHIRTAFFAANVSRATLIIMNKEQLSKAIFSPKKVALVGSSSDSKKNSGRPQRYLETHGYTGKIFPVNPKNEFIQGVAAYPSVSSLPDGIEHVFIMVAAEKVKSVLEEAISKRIKIATIYSDGFGEQNREGSKRQAELVRIARDGGIRILGPNSMGVIDTTSRLTLSVSAVLELPSLLEGNIGLISQSGTILGSLLSRGRARNIGFSKLVSVGNESDLGVGELAELLIDDPRTETIILFLEAIRNPEAIARMARRAFLQKKPVIVYKLGRSDLGRKLAITHSGALTGDDRSVQAFFNHNGIIRVDILDQLIEAPFLFRGRSPSSGRRVSVVTTTGGGAAMIMDRLGASGVQVAKPSDNLRKGLKTLGVAIGKGPIIDLTMAGAKKGIYDFVLNELINASNCDAIVVVVGSSGLFNPDIAIDPLINLNCNKKFLAVFVSPEAPDSLKKLAQAGVAVFRSPEACSNAVIAALDWCPPSGDFTKSIKLKKINCLLAQREELDQKDAGEIFAELGIPQSKFWIVEQNKIPKIEFPIAVKVLAGNVPHKTDVKGVALNIKNLSELKRAMRQISSSVQQKGYTVPKKFLIQPMHYGICEFLLGYKYDQEVGPVIILGTGGQYTEVFNDIVVKLAPVSLSSAKDMIREVKGFKLIQGYRSNPKGDLNALAKAIVNFSKLAHFREPKVLEAEINPLIIKEDGRGVVAVDALLYRD